MKETPKEIFIPSSNIEAINARGQKCGMFYTTKEHDTEYKYLSETHVKELLSSKDKEINDLLKIVAERNAEIADKDKEIEELKADADKRFEMAESYIINAEGIFCEGAVFSESGYSYNEVIEAIKIAAGINI